MPTDPPELPYGVRLLVAYDGTQFNGWQAQDFGRTVQQTIESAIDGMAAPRSRLRGCSRTDSGVHAAGQIAAFATARQILPKGWMLGLNGLLPDDVAVRAVAPCHPRYEPRFDAVHKLYRYLVCVGPTRDPLSRRRAWHLGPGFARRDLKSRDALVANYLDIEAMQEAARLLEGERDFHAFRASADNRLTTTRHLRAVRVVPGYSGREDLLAIEVDGDAFMKNMVRILVGTLVEVGRQRMPPDRMGELLGPDSRRPDAGPTAPAHGLTLERIWLKLGDRDPGQ